MRRIISRPVPDQVPDIALPLYVRSVGYNEVLSGWKEVFPASAKQFSQVFWCVDGEGVFVLKGKAYPVRKDQIFLRFPGEDHEHYCASERWAYHWCTFDGAMAVDFIKAYGFSRFGVDAGPCPSELFLKLEALMKEMSPFSQKQMLSVAIDILSRIGYSFNENAPDSVVQRFLKLAADNYTNETVNVNCLADMLGVHRTTLSRLFSKHMRMSPCDYIMRLRVQKALSLLRESDLPIHEVGVLSGIAHRGYFCSLIKRMTGVSPAVYRARRMG